MKDALKLFRVYVERRDIRAITIKACSRNEAKRKAFERTRCGINLVTFDMVDSGTNGFFNVVELRS